jgi:hypothetical protein
MKRAILGSLLGAGLVVAAAGLFGQRSEVFAQKTAAYQPIGSGSGSDLIAFPTPWGDKGQVLTVVDPRQQTIAIYAIDLPSGKISLRSVRAIRWDLQMMDFNGDNPLPREIRLQLEQR